MESMFCFRSFCLFYSLFIGVSLYFKRFVLVLFFYGNLGCMFLRGIGFFFC